MKKEESLQIAVCNYIRYQYPKVKFNCDIASGIKLTIGQAVKAKQMRSSRAWPDLFLAEPRNGYHGLFIELKREGVRLTKKNGEHSDEHVKEQAEMLDQLSCLNFAASFAVGFDQAKQLIDSYLNN